MTEMETGLWSQRLRRPVRWDGEGMDCGLKEGGQRGPEDGDEMFCLRQYPRWHSDYNTVLEFCKNVAPWGMVEGSGDVLYHSHECV